MHPRRLRWSLLDVELIDFAIEAMHAGLEPREGDIAQVLVHEPERERAAEALRSVGWEPVPEPAAS